MFKGSERAPQPERDAKTDAAPQITPGQIDPAQLRQLVATHFDAEQLRNLCVDLDVSYENLAGEGPVGKARELVLYLQRRNRLPELAGEVARLRPGALRAAGVSPGPKPPPQARRIRRRSDIKPASPAAPPAPGAVDPVQLSRLLDRHFSANELRSLCFDLKIDYDNLQGETKVIKARSLVQYFARRGDVAQLVQVCAQLRPKAAWHTLDTAAPKASDASAQQAKLRRMLAQHLDESQVRDLCASLGVDYGSLPGAGKDDKTRELVARLARHGRSNELVAACMGLRPDVAWEQALHATEGESPAQAAPQKAAQVKLSPRVKLSRMMASHFDEVQLRDLCSGLSEDYDDLAGRGKSGKVRELVISLDRRGRTLELVEACARRRPDLDW